MDNELKCILKAKKCNIKLARNIAQIFFSQLDSTLSFLNEIKTIVSEAVTNAIIHGYNEDEMMDIFMNLSYDENYVYIEITKLDIDKYRLKVSHDIIGYISKTITSVISKYELERF